MTQGPYQSNILRFFVRQYWQGVARHRQAVRQTRSKVTFGVSVGSTFALLPVYAAVRVSQLVTATLKETVDRTWALGVGRITNPSLEGSVFDGRLAFLERREDLETEALQYADQRFSESVLFAERAMSRSLKLVGSYLSNAQRAQLAGQKEPLLIRLLSWGKRSLLRLSKPAGRLSASSAIHLRRSVLFSKGSLPEPALISGIASDVKTRSLVLVIGFRSTWNALTPAQQARLQHHVRQFWTPPSSLIRPVHSFWLYVLRYVLQMIFALRKRPQTKAPSVLSELTEKFSLSGSVELPTASLQGGLTTGPHGELTKAKSAKIQLSQMSASLASSLFSELERVPIKEEKVPCHNLSYETLGFDNDTMDAWDVDVITISYVEHPLERLLKWIDRIFVWLEKQWHLLWARQIGER